MSIPYILIELLWLFIAMTLMLQYIEPMKEISTFDRVIVVIILLVGAPMFLIVNVLETILDAIFPEGWNDEDDIFKGY